MNHIKRISLCLVLSLGLSIPVFSVDYGVHTIGPYGTLNDTDNPLVIPANKAQDLLNVDLSPGGLSVMKRKGYGTSFTLTHTTSPTHGCYNFYDATGNDVSLFFHDNEMSSSINGAEETVLFTIGTVGSTYDCTDIAGSAYCVNTDRDGLIKTDGSTYSYMTIVATGTMITSTQERLVVAGISGSPNKIAFSEANDFTDWTVASLPTDPISYTVAAAGASLTHITYAFNRIMWFKETSFGYLLEGPTHGDWILRTVSPTIGTNDNTSVYESGVLEFRGQEGHIYGFDGTNLVRLTRDVKTFVDNCQLLRRDSWTETTSADFEEGAYSYDNYIDTETVDGQIQLDFPDEFTAYRDGSDETKDIWSDFTYDDLNADSNVEIYGNQLKMTATEAGHNAGVRVRTSYVLDDFAKGTTYHFKISEFSTYSATSNILYVLLSTVAMTTEDATDSRADAYWVMAFKSTSPGTVDLQSMTNDVDGTLWTGVSTGIALPATFDLYLSTTDYNLYINSISTTSGTHTWPNEKVYFTMEYEHNFGASGAPVSHHVIVDDFQVAPSTPVFTSAVFNMDNLTAWDNFYAGKSGDSHTFYIRSATATFAVDCSTIAWTAISNGTKPTISTGTHVQVKDVIVTDSPSDKPILHDFTVSWVESAVSDKAYAAYFDEAIWWSVAYGGDATTNNRILKHDLNNNGWLIYDLTANDFMIRGTDLYFGDSTTGYVYKYGDSDSDNGSAIESYWKSKDFFVDSPFTDKEFNLISFVSKSVEKSTVTVTYELDATTEGSYEVESYEYGSAFYQNNRNLPQGSVGKTINIKFGNNAADQYWELYGLQVGVRSKPWRETE